jgi:hypothetical protein
VSFGSASHARDAAPKPRSGEGGPVAGSPSLTRFKYRSVSFGSASHAKDAAPKPRSGEGGHGRGIPFAHAIQIPQRELRLGKPREECRAEAA